MNGSRLNPHQFRLEFTLTRSTTRAARLDDSAVHVKIHMTTSLDLALYQRVRMNHVHKLGVRSVQLVIIGGRNIQRHRRVQAADARQHKRSHVQRHKVGDMRAQRKANQVNVIGAALQDAVDQLRNADATVPGIVHGTQVARAGRQAAPVDVEQIVLATLQVL